MKCFEQSLFSWLLHRYRKRFSLLPTFALMTTEAFGLNVRKSYWLLTTLSPVQRLPGGWGKGQETDGVWYQQLDKPQSEGMSTLHNWPAVVYHVLPFASKHTEHPEPRERVRLWGVHMHGKWSLHSVSVGSCWYCPEVPPSSVVSNSWQPTAKVLVRLVWETMQKKKCS